MALCQACHLSVQGRVNPYIGLLWLPRPWSMPYIAGFYESGRGVRGPLYDLARWIGDYTTTVGPCPAWAPVAASEKAVG